MGESIYLRSRGGCWVRRQGWERSVPQRRRRHSQLIFVFLCIFVASHPGKKKAQRSDHVLHLFFFYFCHRPRCRTRQTRLLQSPSTASCPATSRASRSERPWYVYLVLQQPNRSPITRTTISTPLQKNRILLSTGPFSRPAKNSPYSDRWTSFWK